jgi:hypothetical protein
MAAEVSGARFVCRIAGAPAGESSFTVQVTNATDQPKPLVPLCSGSLAVGAGICSGSFIDREASGLGQVTLAATLQPSGAAVGPLVLGRSTQPETPVAPMQFFPLPEP